VFIIEVEENSTSENTASEIYCNLQVDSNLIVLTFVEIWTKAPSPSKSKECLELLVMGSAVRFFERHSC
jgi:hypothetical protein